MRTYSLNRNQCIILICICNAILITVIIVISKYSFLAILIKRGVLLLIRISVLSLNSAYITD